MQQPARERHGTAQLRSAGGQQLSKTAVTRRQLSKTAITRRQLSKTAVNRRQLPKTAVTRRQLPFAAVADGRGTFWQLLPSWEVV